MNSLPRAVLDAQARAAATSFIYSCEPDVGHLLATLAAAVPEDGRILELGTGCGVGLAWLIHGLGDREDVEVVTVELHPATQSMTSSDEWPRFVQFVLGDGAALVHELGKFDLVFADAPGGKLTNLEGTIGALQPGGILLVDDMDLSRQEDPNITAALATVRERLVGHPELVVAELEAGSGIILCTLPR